MVYKPRKPTLIAYFTGKNRMRKRIGAAWPLKNGDGFFVKLDHLPSDGMFELMVNKECDDKYIIDNFERHVV